MENVSVNKYYLLYFYSRFILSVQYLNSNLIKSLIVLKVQL